jgi:8-oxo-dGTP pyrophosphatase MutT (NUDIX family)
VVRVEIRAAGGVVWRPVPAVPYGVEVLIVRRPRYGDWSLPKGKLDPGETWLQAAVREVGEETGYAVEVGGYLGEVAYPDRHHTPPRRKVVRYWAMRGGAGSFTPGAEVDEIRWLPPSAAIESLSYDPDRTMVRTFLRSLVRDEPG